jgi:hypothetical protein
MEQDGKRIRRWLRALEIAKILFEDQGYHARYLQAIEACIRRCKMYSPRISQDLIPGLYRLSKRKRKPMTTMVDAILREYLEKNIVPLKLPPKAKT